jgi:MFS family permease
VDFQDPTLKACASVSRRRATLRRVLANRHLRRVESAFLAFGAAELGVWVAVLVYAYQRGGTTLAGVIALVQLLPAAVVAPLASRWVDRRGAGTMLALGYVILAITVAATAVPILLGVASVVVYAAATTAACAVTLVRPAQSTLLPDLVSDPADLTAANAVTGWVESLSVLIGPALAGLMIELDGPGAALALFAVALAAGAVLTAPMAQSPQPELTGARAEGDHEYEDGETPRALLAALRQQPGSSVLLTLMGVEFIALGALDILEVVLAIQVLGLGPQGAGYLGAAFGFGGVLGGLGTFGLVGRKRMAEAILLGAAAGGAAFLALGVWPTVAGAFLLLGGVGAAHVLMDVACRTVLHRVMPVNVRGRVFGLLEGLAMLGLAIGSISVPALVAAGGAEAALGAVGGLLLASAIVSAPALRRIERASPTPVARLAALQGSELFGLLSPPVLEDLAAALIPHPVQAGEVVIREGEPGDRVYLVAEGELDVSVSDRWVAARGPGAVIGEIALLRDGFRTATVTALTPGLLYALERAPFLEALTGSAPASHAAERLVNERLSASG